MAAFSYFYYFNNDYLLPAPPFFCQGLLLPSVNEGERDARWQNEIMTNHSQSINSCKEVNVGIYFNEKCIF